MGNVIEMNPPSNSMTIDTLKAMLEEAEAGRIVAIVGAIQSQDDTVGYFCGDVPTNELGAAQVLIDLSQEFLKAGKKDD